MQEKLRISRGPGDNEEEVLERISRERFIRLGTALGVGAGCASLVACGGGASSSGGGSGGGKSGGGDSGGGDSGGGDFVAYSAVCTHQACTVAYQDGNLACPCHGSTFDPANGASVVTGPATRPLPEIPVKVEGGEVVRA